MTLAASIDLGTNTFRLLIADVSPTGSIRPLRSERIITRLGEGFHTSNGLTTTACERSRAALSLFTRIISEHRVSTVYAAATGVIRAAVNGGDFINEIETKTGIAVKVLSGDEEARLTHAGVLSAIPAADPSLMVDIGGGSTELVVSQNGLPLKTASIDLGVVYLSEMLLLRDPPDHRQLLSLKTFIAKKLDFGMAHLLSFPQPPSAPLPAAAQRLIGTAGSITTLAAIDQAMKRYDPRKINGYLLTHSRVTGIYQRLVAMKRDERKAIPGLEQGREDLIIPGALILLHLMQCLGFDAITVSDGSLLEGILLDALASRKTS